MNRRVSAQADEQSRAAMGAALGEGDRVSAEIVARAIGGTTRRVLLERERELRNG